MKERKGPQLNSGIKIILFLLAFSFSVMNGQADSRKTQKNNVSIGISAGFHTSKPLGTLYPLQTTADVPPVDILLENSFPAGGLSFGYNFNPHLEVQGCYSYSGARIMNDIGTGAAGIPLGRSKASDASLSSFTAGILYYFLDRRLSPYISAGLGAMTLRTEQYGSKTRPHLSYGIGVKAHISDKIFVVMDLQHDVSFFEFNRDFNFFHLSIYRPDFNRTQHGTILAVGLGFLI